MSHGSPLKIGALPTEGELRSFVGERYQHRTLPSGKQLNYEYEDEELEALAPLVFVPETDEIKIEGNLSFLMKSNEKSTWTTSMSIKDDFEKQPIVITSIDGQKVLTEADKKRTEALGKVIARTYNLEKAIPVSLKITGAHVGNGVDVTPHFCFQVADSNGKPMQNLFAFKNSTSKQLVDAGYPLYQHGPNSSVLDEPPPLLDEHKQYWHLSITELLSQAVPLPGGGTSWYLVKQKTLAAAMIHWAVSVKNDRIPSWINNPTYVLKDKELFEGEPMLKILKHDFDEVVDAYKSKISEMKDKAFDVKTIYFTLNPVPLGSKSPANHPVWSINDNKELVGYVSFELWLHVTRNTPSSPDKTFTKFTKTPMIQDGSSGEEDESSEEDEE